MILNGFRCDSCTKEHHDKSYPPLLPLTWFMVRQTSTNRKEMQFGEPDNVHVFCSPTCVITHMKKLEAIQ